MFFLKDHFISVSPIVRIPGTVFAELNIVHVLCFLLDDKELHIFISNLLIKLNSFTLLFSRGRIDYRIVVKLLALALTNLVLADMVTNLTKPSLDLAKSGPGLTL